MGTIVFDEERVITMTKMKETLQSERDRFDMLRDLFNEMYSEINEMKKKKPDGVVNAFKVERINRVLKPLYELMKDEPYASYLEMIPEPKEEKTGRSAVETGLTYSDVMLILSQYRSGLSQFFQKYFYSALDFGSFGM